MKKVKATIQQQGIWFQSNTVTSSVFYTQMTAYRVSGNLDIRNLEDSLNEIVSNNEILRTNFVLEGNELYQIIKTDFSISNYIEVVDLRHLKDYNQRVKTAKEIEQTTFQYSFDLQNDPLLKVKVLRLDENEYLLLLLRNHIIFDVKSFAIFLDRLAFVYNRNITNDEKSLAALKQYESYALEQQTYRGSNKFNSSFNFWKNHLDGYQDQIIQNDIYELNEGKLEIDSVHLDLPEKITKEISTYALKKKVLKSAIYNLAFNLILHEYFGITDILIGNVYENRRVNGIDFSNSMGVFANILMFRNQLQTEHQLLDELRKVNENLLSVYNNGSVNNEDILRELQLSGPSVRYSLNVFKEPKNDLGLQDLVSADWQEVEKSINNFSRYDISFNFHEHKNKVQLRTLYKRELFTIPQAVQLQKSFVQILEIILFDPDQLISDLKVSGKPEWNKTEKQLKETENNNQIKIEGHNIDLEKIKEELIGYPKIKDVALKGFSKNSDNYIVGYYISENKIDEYGLIQHLSSSLPPYMVPEYLIQVSSFPYLPQGGIDYKNLPIVVESHLKTSRPISTTEKEISKLFNELLEKEEMPVNRNFFVTGGHSLKATNLLVKLNKKFNVDLKIIDIFNYPTIRGISNIVDQSTIKIKNKIPKAPKKSSYALTPSQKRLYILSKFGDVGLTYNVPQTVLLSGKINSDKLKSAIKKLIERHEPLRTSFEIEDAKPVQIIHEQVEFNVEFEKINFSELEESVNDSIKEFDISSPGLLRVKVFDIIDKGSALFVDFHHIIMDGVSQAIFNKELNALYHGKSLKELEIQCKDYSEWRFEQEKEGTFISQKDFWKEQYSLSPKPLSLPLDFQRPAIYEYDGATYSFELDRDLTNKIKSYVKQKNLTLFTFFIGAFGILLSKYSRESEVTIGSANANRGHFDIMNSLGLFMNLVPLRVLPESDKLISDFFSELKSDILKAFDNQDFTLENIIEHFEIENDLSRNKLFDVLFILQNTAPLERNFLGSEGEKINFKGKHARYDMTLVAKEELDKFKFYFEFNTSLFAMATIERMSALFSRILSLCVLEPSTTIGKMELMNSQEKKSLIKSFNSTKEQYPQSSLIHTMFEETAFKNPDRIAVYFDEEVISYDELNRRANQLAGHLSNLELPIESVIAVKMERSIEMIITILGIIKSGFAYVPIGTDFPEQRIVSILEKSEAKVLICKEQFFLEFDIKILQFRDIPFNQYSDENLNLSLSPNNLAYIIFTSGSTGTPKGVMIEHTSVINRIHWMQRMYPIDHEDVILQKTTYTFDVSVWELFWWMFSGSSLALLTPGGEKDPNVIARAIERYKVSTMHFVPSMFQIFLKYLNQFKGLHAIHTLKYLFASGEELKVNHVHEFQRLFQHERVNLINLYGPTEATVDVSYFNCPKNETVNKVPIGKPIDNIQLYIIDKDCNVLPIGIPGELAISGVGVARGYINDEELTNDKFISNPNEDIERLYKTGDLARWLPDGNIEFLGRINSNSQVKIRGFRIELGEIENSLIELEFVSQAVISIKKNNEISSQLIAYVVLSKENFENYFPSEDIKALLNSPDSNSEELKIDHMKTIALEHLKNKLPKYMIPHHLVILDNLPFLSNGKIDRKSLPIPEIEKPTFVPPRNATDNKLANIWREILNIKDVDLSISDEYFKIGGNSLNAALMLISVAKEFNVTISLIEFYKSPSIQSLSDMIELKISTDQLNESEFKTIEI